VVRQICRSEAFDAIIRECIPHTSQVVYSFAVHHALRFDQELKFAGEDRLFWLELAYLSRATTYSTAIMGHRGRGVSIYRDTLSWDSPHGLSRVLDQMVLRKKILAAFDLTAEQRALLHNDLQRSCNHFVFLSLRNSVRQPRTVAAALARMSRDFPQIWRMVPTAIRRVPAHRAELVAAA
jgi:succinoglycan biosynthesis protein ExoW